MNSDLSSQKRRHRANGLSSSETQGQIVGARKSLNGWEKNGAKKSKNGEKHSVLFFSSRHFSNSARLDFPSPHYLPLGLNNNNNKKLY